MSRWVSSAWIRTPSSKFRLRPVQEGHHQGIAGLDAGYQVLPAGALEGLAAGHVGEDQLGPNAVVGQQPELGLQIPGIIVGLADAGVAVGDWQRGHGEASGESAVGPGVQQTGVFEHLALASLPSFAQVFNNPVQQ